MKDDKISLAMKRILIKMEQLLKPEEPKRRNGYYFDEVSRLYYPSATTILKACGDPQGLLNWAAHQGGMGVATHLLRNRGDLDLMNVMQVAKEHAECALSAELGRTSNFGRNVHEGIECYLKNYPGRPAERSEIEEKALQTVIALIKEVGFESEAVEEIIINRSKKYAGRLDWVGLLSSEAARILSAYCQRSSDTPRSGRIIVDFKTGTVRYEQQVAQLAAYAHAYEAKTGKKVSGGLIVQIYRERPDKVKCYFVGKTEMRKAWNGFKIAQKAWYYFEAPNWYKNQKKEKNNENRKVVPVRAGSIRPQENGRDAGGRDLPRQEVDCDQNGRPDHLGI